jgi:hypothetical protein
MGQFQKIGDTSRFGGEVAEKFEIAKRRLSDIRREISSVVESIPASDAAPSAQASVVGPPVIIRCKNWEDFRVQALGAENVSFLYREEDKSFQVDAVKGGRIYTYSGQLPSGAALLRNWLSKELGTDGSRVLEGILALG